MTAEQRQKELMKRKKELQEQEKKIRKEKKEIEDERKKLEIEIKEQKIEKIIKGCVKFENNKRLYPDGKRLGLKIQVKKYGNWFTLFSADTKQELMEKVKPFMADLTELVESLQEEEA